MRLARGMVAVVTLGHEQRGTRPCVVLSDPEIIEDLRFPLVAVVPITATPGTGALYPELKPGPSGLSKVSYALTDQLRSVDKRRVKQVFGRITQEELDAIDLGVTLFLGLGAGD